MISKTHLFDDRVKEEDYSNSPHVLEAIRNKDYAMCGAVNTGRTVDNIEEVTCLGCLRRMEERGQKQTFTVKFFNDYIQNSLDSGISDLSLGELINRLQKMVDSDIVS